MTAENLKDIKPVGDFILNNAKGITLPDGTYYHYSDVCLLLKAYHEHKMKVENMKMKTCDNCGCSI